MVLHYMSEAFFLENFLYNFLCLLIKKCSLLLHVFYFSLLACIKLTKFFNLV